MFFLFSLEPAAATGSRPVAARWSHSSSLASLTGEIGESRNDLLRIRRAVAVGVSIMLSTVEYVRTGADLSENVQKSFAEKKGCLRRAAADQFLIQEIDTGE